MVGSDLRKASPFQFILDLPRGITDHAIDDILEFLSGGIFAVGFVADEEVSSLLQNFRHLRKASFKPRPEVNCLKGGGKVVAVFFELQVRHVALLHLAASAAYHRLVIFRCFLNGKRGVVDRCQPGIRITLQQFSGAPPHSQAQ